MDQVTAQMLLLKCRGNEVWDATACKAAGIPDVWIEELTDRYESGFDSDRNSLYVDGRLVNQFEGVSDLMLAIKLAEYIGIDWENATKFAISRTAKVEAIQAELDEI